MHGWVVEIDAAGLRVRENYYYRHSTKSRETFNAIDRTRDGYVVAGYATEDITEDDKDDKDLWVIHLNADLTVQRERAFGGDLDDEAHAVVFVPDVPQLGDVIIVAGETASYGGADKDFWILVLDPDTLDVKVWTDPSNPARKIVLQVAIGGEQNDVARAILPLDPANDRWVFAGETRSFGAGAPVTADFWVLQTTRYLTNLWQFTFGGPGNERAFALSRSGSDIVVAGDETSFHPPYGDPNLWVLKIDQFGGGIMWQRTYGVTSMPPYDYVEEHATSVVEAWDGRLIVGGWATSTPSQTSDLLLLNLDPATGTDQNGWQGYYDMEGGRDSVNNLLYDPGEGFLVARVGRLGLGHVGVVGAEAGPERERGPVGRSRLLLALADSIRARPNG